MALVSILMPYRNVAATLREAATSVLAERGVPLELVAIDDGSDDAGPQIMAELAARDGRVQCIQTGGVGIAAALSCGLEAAQGDLIARMDGDDVSLPGRFASQLELLQSDASLGAVGTQVEGFPDAAVGEGLRLYIAWQNALVTSDDHARELFVESPLCHPTALMRRSALQSVGGFRSPPWAEDYDIWLRLDAAGFGLAKVPKVLFRWRHRAGRATFANPLYALARFTEAKAHYLAPKLIAMGRPVVVWGAGPTGKRFARALEPCGVRTSAFVDIDPRKIGRTARGAPIVDASYLDLGGHTVVVAVGARGARAIVRTELARRGFVEARDYVCIA